MSTPIATAIDRIASLIMRWQDATQRFDVLVGERLDLGIAERHCLASLYEGPQKAGAIARSIGLTPAATTSVIDRLERRGLVERKPDPADRRKVLVEATALAHQLVEPYHGAIGAEGMKLLSGYSASELEAIEKFLSDALALQLRHIERLSEHQKPDR